MFAYGSAVRYLLRIAAKNGTVAEDSAWLNDVAPGILDVDADSVPAKFRAAQIVALDAWYTSLTTEELQRRIETLQQVASGFGVDPFTEPYLQMSVLAMRGETEEAIGVALSRIFSESVLPNLDWQQAVSLAQFEEFGKDDRIQAAMQRWQDEQNIQSELVKAYLAELSAG